MTRQSAARIEDQAALWVARMDGDHWDEGLAAELDAWLVADPRHDGALLQAQAAWAMLRPIEATAEADPGDAPRISRRWFVGGAGAAIAASLAGGLALWLPGTTYRTDVGEIRRVPLADGSTAAINTASEVEIAFDATSRRVSIEEGEAWFQVAKEPARPFLVEAGRIRVRAVGTAFSVRRREGGADVLVTEGVVEAWTDGADGQAIRIEAGARAFIADNAAVQRAPAEASSVDRALAWRSGKIDLVGQPLSEAVAEFNRYNRRKLQLADPALAGEQFDGVFRTDDPAGFARMIETSLQVPVDLSNPDAIRIGKPSGRTGVPRG
ncbi:FecR family protein [Sphingosinicella rhizophila]|uniref:FecR domain-containing protein n=1 Tax=Sphingosinicella rhizophila TaxID=3050082 RepID=A0ABU3Q9Q5_9SPHN|nr:FecR domain-containing protein [Sphingosinicella sp. GR2756]MDT9600106.1 FecR domain-containing protein [Sphingosinicella sp. GR2756]